MSEFSRALTELERLGLVCEELVNAPADQLSSQAAIFEPFGKDVDNLEAVANRLRRRAAQTDPDGKKLYGEKMLVRIQDFLSKFDTLHYVYTEELTPKYLHEVEKARQDAERAKQFASELQAAERTALMQRTYDEEAHRAATLLQQESRATQAQEEERERLQREEDKRQRVEKMRRAIVDEVEQFERSLAPLSLEGGLASGLKVAAAQTQDLSDFKLFLNNLTDLFSSIVGSTDTVSLRLLRVANRNFQRGIGGKAGSAMCLRSFGFRLEPRRSCRPAILQAAEEIRKLKGDDPESGPSKRPPSTRSDPNENADDDGADEDMLLPSAGGEDFDELFWWLEEPDPIENFEDWVQWVANLERGRDFVSKVQEALRAAREILLSSSTSNLWNSQELVLSAIDSVPTKTE